MTATSIGDRSARPGRDDGRRGDRTHGRNRRTGGACTRGDHGQATVEFALVLPVVALLLVGLVELARLGALQVAVVDAARAGARAAAVDPRPEVAQQAAGGDAVASMAVEIEVASGPPALVTVRVRRSVTLLPGLGWTAVDLEASSTMLVEDDP